MVRHTSDRREWFFPSAALGRPELLPPTNGCLSNEQKSALTALGASPNDVAVDITLATETPVAFVVTSVTLTFLNALPCRMGP